MKVVKFTLDNILGFEHFEMDLNGEVTEIIAENGTGKTTLIEGLSAAIGGGDIANLKNVNVPADEPAKAVLVLHGDQPGEDREIIIERTEGNKCTAKRSVGDSAAMEKIPAPQRFLNSIHDAIAVNPVNFLNAKDDKERIQKLLEALPLEMDMAEMWAAIGIDPVADKLPPIPVLDHPLKQIAAVREAIFTTRTGVNTSERDKRATVEQIRRDIPAEQPRIEDIGPKQAELDALRDEIATNRNTAQAETRRIKAEVAEIVTRREETLASELAAYNSELRADYEAVKGALESEIEQIRSEAEKRVLGVCAKIQSEKDNWQFCLNERKAGHETIMSESRADAAEKIAAADAQYEAATIEINLMAAQAETLASEIAALRQAEKSAAGIAALRSQADKQEAEADSLDALSKRYTEALKALDVYKAELTKDLPIKGLDLSGGEIRVNGIPWKQLNTQQKTDMAVDISCLRFKDKPLKLVLVDNAESLDTAHRRRLAERIVENGGQAFITAVGDKKFTAGGRGQ